LRRWVFHGKTYGSDSWGYSEGLKEQIIFCRFEEE